MSLYRPRPRQPSGVPEPCLPTGAKRARTGSTKSNTTYLRRQPIEDRKLTLKSLLRKQNPGIAFNRHFDVEGAIVFHHACKLGREGIVSKRLGSSYYSGRSRDWIKIKNPAALAVKREAEEEWR
jgi:ATP-dependent DNA ligase